MTPPRARPNAFATLRQILGFDVPADEFWRWRDVALLVGQVLVTRQMLRADEYELLAERLTPSSAPNTTPDGALACAFGTAWADHFPPPVGTGRGCAACDQHPQARLFR